MDKTIKCLLLKTNQVIVGEVNEVSAELGDPDCKIINPYLLDNDTLVDWLTFTDQNEIMMRSDDILTVVDPSEKILKNYESIKH